MFTQRRYTKSALGESRASQTTSLPTSVPISAPIQEKRHAVQLPLDISCTTLTSLKMQTLYDLGTKAIPNKCYGFHLQLCISNKNALVSGSIDSLQYGLGQTDASGHQVPVMFHTDTNVQVIKPNNYTTTLHGVFIPIAGCSYYIYVCAKLFDSSGVIQISPEYTKVILYEL